MSHLGLSIKVMGEEPDEKKPLIQEHYPFVGPDGSCRHSHSFVIDHWTRPPKLGSLIVWYCRF